MDESLVKEFMANPTSARVILSSSLKSFIQFFHWYLYHENFIFMDFHSKIISKLEDIAFGKNKKRNLVLNMPPRHGKLISDDTPVLTRGGWKRHGDLVVGDEVLGINGEYVKVLAISPKACANCRVEFSDGDEIYCHENHEWVVESKGGERFTKETKWFLNHRLSNDKEGRGHSFYYKLPFVDSILGDSKSLPVQPYTLGVWLGDGTNTKPYITGDRKDSAIIDGVKEDGYSVRKIYVNSKTGVYTYVIDRLNDALHKVGMCFYQKRCEKHIPEEYLTASKQQRLSLLAGLLDTDGYLEGNRYRYTTTDERLKDDFVSLISTFNWRASISVVPPQISSSGIVGRKSCYVIGFNPDYVIPCRLSRKRIEKPSKKRKTSITKVEKGDFGKIGNCIEVEGGIYLVGKRLKPTHNSVIMKYFCSWCYMLNPMSNCIYTSYSDTLISDFSKEIRDLVTSPAFNAFTGIKLNKSKSSADYWAVERGGGFRAATLSGGVTGFGYGVSGDEFGGVCFPYDEEVWTNRGKIAIGEIVDNKLDVLVWSFDGSKVELKPIERYIKNPKSEMVEVYISNGTSIKCTPDHKFWTKNRGYVKACELNVDDILLTSHLDEVKTLGIVNIGSAEHSYCLTIRDNHNMFVGDVLVSNCIVDDPLKASNVVSRAEVQKCIDDYTNSLTSRANNKAKSPMILIMQRLAVDDLTGYVLENEPDDWDWIKLPALDEERGVALWEQKFPVKELLKLKKQSPFVYYGQYQQEPIVIGGSLIKSEWFRYYNPSEEHQYQITWINCDTAQKKGEANDYSVLGFWGKTYGNQLHLLDMVRGKFDAKELKEQIIMYWNKCKRFKTAPYGIYIEDKSSGIGTIQELKKDYPIPVIPISRARHKDDNGMWVSQDKVSRVMTAVPYISNGWVYLPNSERDDISNLLLSETSAFNANLTHKHDDMVDVMCDAIDIAFGATGISSIFI